MECMAQEPVLFEDILCQIVDMIGPEVSLCSYPCISVPFLLVFCFIPLQYMASGDCPTFAD